MIPDFETALSDLISQYAELKTPTDDMISALELRLMALREEEAAAEAEDGE